MKRHNIFLNSTERQALEHIKKIHNLSFSTIIDIVINQYWIFEPFKKDIIEYASNIQQLTCHRKKSCIKIKNLHELTDRQINGSLFYYIYNVDKQLSTKYDEVNQKQAIEKTQQTIRSNINRTFQKTIDDWANYNAFCRMKERYQRENQ